MKLLRDPIAHFILIGLILVAVNHFWTAWQGENGRTIEVSSDEIARLEKLWANTAGRLPTGEDRQMIIDQFIQDEVLMREAKRLGLDDNDVIIHRRLAQKMDFLIAENPIDDPTDAELKQWFDENRDQFAASERRSFRHVYFSPERHRDRIENVARTARNQIKAGADWKAMGDPFIQKRSYAAIPQSEVTRLFGSEFAESIFRLEANDWSAPLGSAYGLHLVRIETIDGAADAEFEPIKLQVADAWREQKAAIAKQESVRKLVNGYTVIVEDSGN